MTDEEYVAHFSIWAAMKSPLIMTNAFSKIDPATLSILQNTAVLAVSQDSVGSSATRRWRYYVEDTDEFGHGEIQLFTGSLAGGDQLVLFFNAGSKDRYMNATLSEIFWENAPRGTAPQVQQAWDIYDLWGNRMSNDTASAILNGTVTSSSPGYFNITEAGGAKQVFSQVPPSNSSALMGKKIGSVEPQGTVFAFVKSHGVAMLRLRAQPTPQTRKRNEL